MCVPTAHGQHRAIELRYESGNAVKELLGAGNLKWDENKKQGAYKGQKVYDHTTADHSKSLLGQRSNVRRDMPADSKPPVVPPSEFPQYGEFYGGGGAPPRNTAHVPAGTSKGNGNVFSHAEPHHYGNDALDALTANNYQRQVEHNSVCRLAPPQVHAQIAVGVHNNRRLQQEKQQRHALEATEQHLFGNSTAASILKTRPW
jgi:hypothetical protein